MAQVYKNDQTKPRGHWLPCDAMEVQNVSETIVPPDVLGYHRMMSEEELVIDNHAYRLLSDDEVNTLSAVLR